jgi:hypothetical protein
MLSNRESARRSRRRKLEHVSTLEGQINMHKAENMALVERLREVGPPIQLVPALLARSTPVYHHSRRSRCRHSACCCRAGLPACWVSLPLNYKPCRIVPETTASGVVPETAGSELSHSTPHLLKLS